MEEPVHRNSQLRRPGGQAGRWGWGAAVLVALAALGMRSAPAWAQERVVETTLLHVEIAPSLEVIAAPAPELALGGAPTAPGAAATGEIAFVVRSNAPWGVLLAGSPDGLLREYNLQRQEFVTAGRSTDRPVEWSTAGEDVYRPLTGEDAPALTGLPPTGTEGREISLSFRYVPGYGDETLPTGFVYATTVRYTIGVEY